MVIRIGNVYRASNYRWSIDPVPFCLSGQPFARRLKCDNPLPEQEEANSETYDD